MSNYIVQYWEISIGQLKENEISYSSREQNIAQFAVDSLEHFDALHIDFGVIKVEVEGKKMKATEEVLSYIEQAKTKIYVLYRLYKNAGDKEEMKLSAVYLSKVLQKP